MRSKAMYRMVMFGMTAAATAAAGQPCEQWLPTQGRTSFMGNVGSMVRLDHDGNGPALDTLYVITGQQPSDPGTPSMSWVAAWDRERWSRLPIAILPFETSVSAIEAARVPIEGIPPRALVIAGRFTSDDGLIRNVATWDGERLAAIGPNAAADFSGVFQCNDLECWDPDDAGPVSPVLVVAGNFSRIGGADALFVAVWNGATWAPLCGGATHVIERLEVRDLDADGPQPPRLLADRWDPITRARVVQVCDGISWQPAPAGVALRSVEYDADGIGPEPVMTYALHGSGDYHGLARWSGAAWEPVTTGWPPEYTPLNHDLKRWDPDGPGPEPEHLLVVGSSTRPHVIPVATFAMFGPDGWIIPPVQPLNAGGNSWSPSAGMNCIEMFDVDGPGPLGIDVIVGGGSVSYSGASLGSVLRWDGAAFTTLGTDIRYSMADFIAHDPDGPGPAAREVYAAGAIRSISRSLCGGLGVSRDGLWHGLGSHDTFVGASSLSIHDPDGSGPEPEWLLGTRSSPHYPQALRWLDGRWQTLGYLEPGIGYELSCLRSFDEDGPGPAPPRIFAAGVFVESGLMVLNGDVWTVAGERRAVRWNWLLEHDPDGSGPLPSMLLAGRSSEIVRWSGSDWMPYASMTTSNLDYDTVYRPHAISCDLDADGPRPAEVVIGARSIETPDGTFAGAAAFDGSHWRGLAGSWHGAVRRITIIDDDADGPGEPHMLLLGSRDRHGIICRIDGGQWSDVVVQQGNVQAALSFQPGVPGPGPGEVFIGGDFSAMAGHPASSFAHLRLAPCCNPDLNCDGSADQSDIACIILAIAGDASCFCQSDPDFNLDGSADQGDVAALISVVAGGDCP